MIDALATPRQKVVAGKSRMDVWIDVLEQARRDAVVAAATNPAWGHTELLEVLKGYGAPEISANTFADWRRKKGLPRVS